MRIVVVGDVLLDVDVQGEATRLCPDAPVPVVDVARTRRRAGGAGLVARMLVEDGHAVTLVTVMSDDDSRLPLERALAGVRVVAGPSGARTPVKTRVQAGQQAVVRVDEGCEPAPVPAVTPAMLAAIRQAGAIVVADYGRGLARNGELRELLAELADDVPIVWDPHPAGAEPVAGVAVVTPNLAEARKFAGTAGATASTGHAGELASELLRQWSSRAVLVTMGAQGATLVSRRNPEPLVLPAPRTAVSDPCGAGDRLAASLAVRLLEGHSVPDAAVLAVHDAAEFLGRGGVGSLQDRPAAVEHPSEAAALAAAVRADGGVVVATGGCFDLLHAGHVRALAAARAMGDCLVVCLNSDASVRRLKGEQRPIMNQQDRLELLLALECVDAVEIFDEDTPEKCLAGFRPDVWVKGGDYDGERLPEAALVESWGGRCETVPYHPARSTTGLADALAKVS
ncbi:PfkB family carbohydrate kinase [Pseudarthrobacter sp. J75]|uniref:PfkB family carbohydrate kinase n=1 Tax=unclassified Pseudarthrobacter TaxID=2647000 RepID=UPI002E7FC374|nr:MULTISPECIES: PfkB family carbohydrate kinase [unclassified Pseudarthrobacter]MEE2523541.1 PfkB family carbohydrate kinase [Pseudarthrobacter sp. J47]MEE2530523.1 PfkB family carbohydrate kinase [Pseudarthrobacter sp. J75]